MPIQSSFTNRIARVQSNAPKREEVDVLPKANIRLPVIAGGLVVIVAAAGLAFTLAVQAPADATVEDVAPPAPPKVVRLGNG